MMPERRALLTAVVLAAPFVLGAATGPVSRADAEVVFWFDDRDIIESSGLVVRGDTVVTTNDSGDSARIFAVDRRTGKTVGMNEWDAPVVDVEALAPAGGDAVWVGDIGDNRRTRDTITVTRVPDVDGGVTTYALRHPRGARDAEALLSHPVTGQLFVVTKGVFSGTVLAAPMQLDEAQTNDLVPVGSAPGLVTDGAFLPGGGAVVLRTYSRAVVFAYPSWRVLAEWDLPQQQQGEGLAVAGKDVLISTEGSRSAVLRVRLPAEAVAADLGGPVWELLRLVGPAMLMVARPALP